MTAQSVALPLAAVAGWIIVQGVIIGLTRFFFVLAKRTWTYGDIKPGEPHGPRWYASLNRAYINTVEAMAIFAPAVLLLLWRASTGTPVPDLAVTLAWAFVGARVVYTLAYVATGYKIWISLLWLAGLGPTIGLWALLVM